MFHRTLMAAFAVFVSALPVSAETFPDRTVQLIVPYAAGGPTDVVARLLSEAMGRDLGQSVVVENVTGAGGTLGASRVAQAKPDGYTVLLHHINMATTPTLYRRLPYDPVNGFEPIGLVTPVPMTILGRRDLPANTLAELVEWLRAKGEGANLADAGLGAASQLCGTLLQHSIGTRVTTVPVRGTAPAMQELLSGRVDVLCDQTTQTLEYIRNGSVKVFAVTTPQRLSVLPDVPTTAEGGQPGVQVMIWHGLYAPQGTPRAVVDRLSRALQFALRDPKLIQRFADMGTVPESQERATPDAHRAFWASEVQRWRPILQAAGQYAD